LLKMLGDVEGLTMMVLPPPGAANLAGLLRQREKVAVKEAAVLEEMDRSALKEAGNIATGSALTAFSKLMGFRLLQSVPDDATDMSGSVMDGIIAEMGRASDRILAVRVGFGIDGENIDGALLFIFDPAASRKIIDAVGRTMARPKR
ncbi:chemotaxis protein CheC, partial [Candidatus Uhrbacteria bacterium]|nr:chemotaxis protein CheC [Candidatus Uhrbacteria bacterium]